MENGFSHSRYPTIASKPDAASSQRLVLKTRVDTPGELSSPIPPGSGHPTWSSKRSRHETSHQKAVNSNRKAHVDNILHKRMALHQEEARKVKRRRRSTFGMMVMNRLKELPNMYDSEDDNSSGWLGPGGLVLEYSDIDDYGEEARRHKKVIDRAIRRLDRVNHGSSMAALLAVYDRRDNNAPHAGDGPLHTGGGHGRTEGHGDRRSSGRAARSTSKGEKKLSDLDRELLGDSPDEDREGIALNDSDADDADLTEEDNGVSGHDLLLQRGERTNPSFDQEA